MAKTIIIIESKAYPGKVYAYHSLDQETDVSASYPASEYRGYAQEAPEFLMPGADFEPIEASEIQLLA